MVEQARDEAVSKGITINGLPIMLKRPSGFGDMENLDLYFRDCVIGGAGAFLVPVHERQHFAEAIKTKIIREIAGGSPKPPSSRPRPRPHSTARPASIPAGILDGTDVPRRKRSFAR